MNGQNFTLFASILEDWNDEKRRFDCEARDIDYCSKSYPITANNVSDAIEAFQKLSDYYDFSVKHINTTVYTYVKAEGDTVYQRADKIPFADFTGE